MLRALLCITTGAIWANTCNMTIQDHVTFTDNAAGTDGGEFTPRCPPPMAIAVESVLALPLGHSRKRWWYETRDDEIEL